MMRLVGAGLFAFIWEICRLECSLERVAFHLSRMHIKNKRYQGQSHHEYLNTKDSHICGKDLEDFPLFDHVYLRKIHRKSIPLPLQMWNTSIKCVATSSKQRSWMCRQKCCHKCQAVEESSQQICIKKRPVHLWCFLHLLYLPTARILSVFPQNSQRTQANMLKRRERNKDKERNKDL